MPPFDLVTFLTQYGWPAISTFLILYVLRDVHQRETAWNAERQKRHEEFMELHKAHLKMQTDTLGVISSLKIVIQQWMDQSKPPFIDWDGETERRKKR